MALAGAGVLTAVRSVVAIDATERAPQLESLTERLARIGRVSLGRTVAPGTDWRSDAEIS